MAQLERRKEELRKLYEKIKVNKSLLEKGTAAYDDRVAQIALLKERIKEMGAEGSVSDAARDIERSTCPGPRGTYGRLVVIDVPYTLNRRVNSESERSSTSSLSRRRACSGVGSASGRNASRSPSQNVR